MDEEREGEGSATVPRPTEPGQAFLGEAACLRDILALLSSPDSSTPVAALL